MTWNPEDYQGKREDQVAYSLQTTALALLLAVLLALVVAVSP